MKQLLGDSLAYPVEVLALDFDISHAITLPLPLYPVLFLFTSAHDGDLEIGGSVGVLTGNEAL